jgi:hypothetical protein
LLPQLALSAETSGNGAWQPLQLVADGKVHSDWVHVGHGRFVVDEGTLRTVPDERGLGLLVYKPRKLGNCQIRVVYRALDARDNAGVYVRIDDGILKAEPAPAVKRDENGKLPPEMVEKMKAASEADQGPWYAVHHGYEVQICDGADAAHRTGSIYSLATAKAVDNQPGQWRTMVITLDGTKIEVEIDGQQVSSFDSAKSDVPARKMWYEPKREPTRPKQGYIGLQTHDPGDVVWFKEVSVRPLPGQGAATK